jgi:phenylacetate-CoA ligase
LTAVELAKSIEPTADLKKVISQEILDQILRLNSEFKHYVPEKQQMPLVTLHLYGDQDWFPVGVKHKYTR